MQNIFRLIILVQIVTLNISLPQSVFPPPSEKQKLKITAYKTEEVISIDGVLDEQVWSQTQVADNFTESFPQQGKKATYDTEVRILYDDYNLYVGAICYHPDAKNSLVIKDLQRDSKYNENEIFNVSIEPYRNNRMPVYTFWVNPYGSQTDQISYDDIIFDYNWDGIWVAQCSVRDSCWIAEIQIPFSTLHYPENSNTWDINFNRNIRDLGEITAWSPYPAVFDAVKMEYSGMLTEINPPDPKLSLKINPYSLLNSSKINEQNFKNKPHFGIDVKWLPGTDTYFDFTINSDFAQADVDNQVVNLGRSSVFLPEKRQFFLENSRLFSLGRDEIFQPFFSRRIGLNENGETLPINLGIRFTQQKVNQSIGALVINQDEKNNSPSATFALARFQRDINENFRLGSMIGIKYKERLNSESSSFNTIGVVDASMKISESLFIRSMLSYSNDSYLKRNGLAFLSEVNYFDNIFIFSWLETIVGKEYNTDLGFLARQDFIYTNPALTINLSCNWFPRGIVYFNPGISSAIFHSVSSGKFEEAQIIITPVSFLFRDNSKISFSIIPSWETLNYIFKPVADLEINPGEYKYVRFKFAGNSDLSAPISGQFDLSRGGYYNGSLNSYFFSIRLAPSPYAAVAVGYTRNDFYNVGISHDKKTTHLLTPELRVALNPSIQLSSSYQHNTDTNKGMLNFRLSWEYRPLSYIYFVFNSVKNIDDEKFASQSDQQNAIIKISYSSQL